MESDFGLTTLDGQASDLARLASKHYGDNTNCTKDSKTQEQQDFTIIWRNLSYKIDLKRWYHIFYSNKGIENQDEKFIFHKICGEAKSRQLTAIMGPSGAGKSSLLHCLFRNINKGVTGQILVEQGNTKSNKNLKICFIPQHDYLNEWLTVREDLLFVSRLKFTDASEIKDSSFFQKGDIDSSIESSSMTSCSTTYVKHQNGASNNTSLINHETNVVRMAELLGLTSCLDAPIKRISGGERKRLSIARELMSKPDILVLDEPTTGLDSLTCYKTVTVLRDLVKKTPNPMVVVVTIHQPERAVFNLFDKTYFLSDGRGVVFDEDPKNAVGVMEDVANISLPSANYNPASFLIELASDKPYDKERILLTNYQRLRFDKSNSSSKIINLLGDKGLKAIQSSRHKSGGLTQTTDDVESNVCVTSLQIPKTSDFDMNSSSDLIGLDISDRQKSLLDNSDPNSYYISNQLADCTNSHSNGMSKDFWHVFILTHRAWLSIIRNPSLTKSRLAFHLLLPLVMLAVFGNKMGAKDSCPILGEGLNIERMRQDISEGTVSRNYDDYRYVCENVSFFFILYYGFSVNIVGIAASFYPLTLNMFRKETANGLYSVGPSLLAQIFAELPLEIFFPTISALLSFKLSGQVGSYLEWRMFTVGFIMFICSYFVQCLGLIAGILFNDHVSSAVIVAQMSLLPFVVTSGFGVRYSRLPTYMQYFAEWSIFKQFVSGFIATRYGFNMCDCSDEKIEESQNTFLTPNVKHTMDYLFSNESNTLGENVKITDLFDKLNDQFMQAQTYGMTLETCDDVRPYIMQTFSVTDQDLYISLVFSIMGTIILKFLVFFLLKYKKL